MSNAKKRVYTLQNNPIFAIFGLERLNNCFNKEIFKDYKTDLNEQTA